MRARARGSSLDRPILRLAIPGQLASVSVPHIGIADTAMIGHLSEVAFLGAVATASVLFDFLFWGAGFLRMGTTSIVSQHHGAGDRSGSAAALYRALVLAAVLGLLVLMICGPVAEIGFTLLGGSDQVQLWGRQYFDVRVLGVPLVLHPTVPTWGGHVRDHAMIPMAAFMMDTSFAMLRLILGGVMERHPTLRIVHSHAGGVLPYLMGRVEEQTERKLPDRSVCCLAVITPGCRSRKSRPV